MSVKYSYIDFFDHKILYREFTEDSSFDEILNSFKEILEKKMLVDKTIGIITDIRGVKFEVNPFVFIRVTKFLKRNPELHNYKLAALTDSPKQVVLATIASKVSSRIKVKPFSTYDGCIKWMTEDLVV
jgi:hypothetical protein